MFIHSGAVLFMFLAAFFITRGDWYAAWSLLGNAIVYELIVIASLIDKHGKEFKDEREQRQSTGTAHAPNDHA